MRTITLVSFCLLALCNSYAQGICPQVSPFLELTNDCYELDHQFVNFDITVGSAGLTSGPLALDLSCVDCVSGVLIVDNNTEFYGDITMRGETMSWDLDNTSVHFWGTNSTVEFAGRESNIQFTQPQGQIIFAMDSCKIRFDGNQSSLELSSTSFIQYKNNSTGSGSASLGSNSPAVTLSSPYTWLKLKSSDGSTVYVPAWK